MLRSSSLLPLALICCAEDHSSPSPQVPTLPIVIAPLDLEGVADAVWDIEVLNGASPREVVWQRRVTASRFGDGEGSLSYVGPCDAAPTAADHEVRVWLVGIYAAEVSAPGEFGAGASSGPATVTGTALPMQNPTLQGPLTRSALCAPNADTPVVFDVTVLRPAQQGFFDIAVEFEDVFCSAKFDCCRETGGVCASDLQLLFDASGSRARTFVLGLACTAGEAGGLGTDLFLDRLELDCHNPKDGALFEVDLALDPSGPTPGNQCATGADGMSACAPLVEEGPAFDADTVLYQFATYRGPEVSGAGGAIASGAYWNVALGVKPAIANCRLRTRATASAVSDALMGSIPAGEVYPLVTWQVDLGACGAEGLDAGNPNAPVTIGYTSLTNDEPTTLDYGLIGGTMAGPICAPACAHGGSCIAPGECLCVGGYTGPRCESEPTSTAKRVFRTQSHFTGDLGGLSGADAKCQAEAMSAGLSGTFKAWLSTPLVSASSRFTQHDGPYEKLIGSTLVRVADDWDDLTDGTLAAPLDTTALGDARGHEQVWTATGADGSAEAVGDCSGWTDGTNSGGVHQGSVGQTSRTDSYWSSYGSRVAYCDESKPLFCFEQ